MTLRTDLKGKLSFYDFPGTLPIVIPVFKMWVNVDNGNLAGSGREDVKQRAD